jgi:hypothetical protein
MNRTKSLVLLALVDPIQAISLQSLQVIRINQKSEQLIEITASGICDWRNLISYSEGAYWWSLHHVDMRELCLESIFIPFFSMPGNDNHVVSYLCGRLLEGHPLKSPLGY